MAVGAPAAERPIIFSAPMVLAIVAGTKTQTRRMVKPPPEHPHFGKRHMLAADDEGADLFLHSSTMPRAIRSPYGKPGDRLWVRESLGYCSEYGHYYAADRTFLCSVFDDEEKQTGYSYECDMREGSVPSIHLPRKWSRITLEVTGVRVERLQDISASDCLAEGIGKPLGRCEIWTPTLEAAAVHDYKVLWESINGPGSWDANPWLWVIEFKRVQGCATA